jgi:hypothetical protein
VGARDQVAEADRVAEQAVVVEIAREQRDPAAAGEVPALPVGEGVGVEPRAQEAFVGQQVALWSASPKNR